MNQDQANGTWDQRKRMARTVWGELTDDDFKKTRGHSADELYGLLQEKFGDTQEAINAKLDQRHRD